MKTQGGRAHWTDSMDYQIQDIEGSFNGQIIENLGNNEYVIKLNDRDQNLKIISMDSTGIEFVLDQKYHKVKYLQSETAKMNLVVNGVPITLNRYTNLNEIVYKNSGGAADEDSETALKSQIPGKVVSIAVEEGASVSKGDTVCTLESMKMQVAIKAHKDGTIKSIKVKEGGTVAKSDPIADIE